MKGKGTVSCRIAVFAKAPVAGHVKTRLIPLLGEEGAKNLYERLLHHTLRVATSAGAPCVELWCSPSSNHPFFVACAARYKIELREQDGTDLGERMNAAASGSSSSKMPVIVVGSDCPALTVEDFSEAASALSQADAVLGPAHDGGYFLLGLKRSNIQLFNNIAWGTEKVLEQTRDRLRELNWAWRELQPKWDIDLPEDYRRFVAEGISLEGGPE